MAYTSSKVVTSFFLAAGLFLNVSFAWQPNIYGLSTVSKCQDSCVFTIVESIPENLTYSEKAPIHLSTYQAHKRLLAKAKSHIHISSFYWTLLGDDVGFHDYSSYQGEDIFNSLVDVLKTGKISVKIAQNNTNRDTDKLYEYGAELRTVDFQRLLSGGVLHTKMWVVDNQHVYIGSANFDWRSYTQTKEVGVLIENCGCLGTDADKLFQVYWYLGGPGAEIPHTWPSSFTTTINATAPLPVYYNETMQSLVYLSSSPGSLCADGRTEDLSAILNVIKSARKFIYISVMDYFPLIIYNWPNRFWPVIDDALRSAAFNNGVTVYLMASKWDHTRKDMFPFLRSLNGLKESNEMDVQVRLFTVPKYTKAQEKIPYSRVNHMKYMVTEQHAYIGTSNWAGDYFIWTGGVAFILQSPQVPVGEPDLRQQLQDVFIRDWSSPYTKPVF